MLVEHLSMKEAQQTVLPRGSRKRRARVGDSPVAAERAKTPRRHQVVPPAQRITKPEPDEDSGLGFDDPHDQPPAGAAETTHLLRAGLVASVRKAARSKEDGAARDSCFVRDVRSASDVQSPTTFLKGDNPVSKCGKYRLELTKEPETRHRARYQTEGSRGAVKDASGKTSPQVTLKGCSEPVALQMYVGSDADGCTPHLFYQSCRVTGKTASASDELLLSGTAVIQTTMTPDKSSNSVSARCDCLGILKQRNVDIESRVAAAQGGGGPTSGGGGGRRSTVLRKGARTTSCRLVFRVTVLNGHGRAETLQIASRSIICTQPQGVPEITKLSISEALPAGGQELIVLGKNFVKDSRVVFTEMAEGGATVWSKTVVPHKDHLQAVHLVCNVPTYWDARLVSPRAVSLTVRSGDRESEGVPFTYTLTTSSAGPSSAAADPDRSTAHDSAEPGRGKQLPNGVSQAAIAINRHFAETGEILLGSNQQQRQSSVEQPKKTVAAVQTELTDATGPSVAVQPPPAPAAATEDSGPADSRSEKVPTLLVPVVTDADQSPNMFVTVALPSSTAAEEAAAAPLLAAPAVWTGQQEQQKPVTQRQEVTVPTAWTSPPPPAVTEGCGAANVWSPPQQPAVSPQGVWPAAVSQASAAGTPQSTTAWSPPLTETAIVQDTWSPSSAPGSAETAAWSSPQPETPAAAETTWNSPKTEPVAAPSAWPSAGAANVAGQEGVWTRPAEAPAETAESIWKQEVESIVSESVQSWATAAETVEAVSQHDWPQTVAAAAAAAAPAAWSSLGETKVSLEHEWPATAGTETRRSWSSESESKASPAASDWSGGAAAAETKESVGGQPWPTLAEVKVTWSQKTDDAQTAPAQAWTGPAAEKTWSAPQQQQQQQQQTSLHSQQLQQPADLHNQQPQQQQASLHSQQQLQPADLHNQQQQGVQQANLHSQQLQQPADLHNQQPQQQQASLHSQQLQQPADLHSQQQQGVQQANLHSQQLQQPADLHSQQQGVQQQPQQQWTAEAAAAAAAEVRSWSREQLADAFRETMTGSPASVPEPAGGGATVATAAAPAPAAPASRSDPMWGEVSFGAPVSAAAEDPLSDLPKGMGLLIDFINSDSV